MEQELDPRLIQFIEFMVPFSLGLLFLTLGRRITWVLAGLVFAFGGLAVVAVLSTPAAIGYVWDMLMGVVTVTPDITADPIPTVAILGALIAAAIGIFSTLRFPRVITAVVGFAMGAFFLWYGLSLFGIDLPQPVFRTLLIVVGAIVAYVTYRQPAETMIILTSLLGSQLILGIPQLNPNSPFSAFVWLLSMLFGIIFQTAVWRREERKKAERAAAAMLPAPAPA